ncbi:MAG: sulfatase activating formylglycine-generating enzyme [Gammaproteobacteria bacterium]|jgi:formylglycine-generating enzyme required for sulfatase activity
MSVSTLRGLAKAHSDKIVDRKHYIRERRRLIDEIVAGKAELIPYSEPIPRRTPESDRTFSDGETTLELPLIEDLPNASDPAEKPKRGLIIACTVVLVAACLGAWFNYSSAPQIEFTEQLPEREMSPQDASQESGGVAILTSFVEQNRWQNEHIVELRRQWLAIDSAQRISVSETSLVHRTTDLIAQKYLEENALLTLSTSQEPRIKQRHLLDLGFALSPGNERIERLDSEWHSANNEVLKNAQRSLEQQAIADSSSFDVGSAAPTLALEESTDDVTEIPLKNDSMDDVEVPVDSTVTSLASDNAEPATIDNIVKVEAESNIAEISPYEPSVETPDEASIMAVPVVSEASDELEPATTAQIPEPVSSKSTAVAKKPLGCRASLAKKRRPYCRDSLAPDSQGPVLAVLPNGTFNMGGLRNEEQPRHAITVGHAFAVSVFEISYREFEQFCTATNVACPVQPWTGPNLPMVNVTWKMASKYTEWLSNVTGAKYRLATESEWEYAARGGTATIYPFGDEILPTDARFSFRAIESKPLANDDRSINRNNFRLYHMVGNVQEWVQDGWEDNYISAPSDASARIGGSNERVVRGGSYADGADKVRSASRTFMAADAANSTTGFRIVREVE